MVGDSNSMRNFIIVNEQRRNYPRFQTSGIVYTLNLHEPSESDPMTWLNNAFKEMRGYFTRDTDENRDFIGVTFSSPHMPNGPAWISFRLIRDFTSEDLFNIVDKLRKAMFHLKLIAI